MASSSTDGRAARTWGPATSDKVDYTKLEAGPGDDGGASTRRLVLLVTALAVAAVAAVFAWVGWDQAGRIATVMAGLVAVAALGGAVWAALPGPRSAVSDPPPTSDTAVGEEAAPPGLDPAIEQHTDASDQARIYQAGRDQHFTER